MISLTPIVAASIFLVGAFFVANSADARAARRLGFAFALTSTIVALLGPLLISVLGVTAPTGTIGTPRGLLAVAPIVTGLVGMLAIGLAPLSTHHRSTFLKMMVLLACAEAFLASGHPLVLSLLWTTSSVVAWLGLRRHCPGRGWHRLFGLYQGISVVCFAVGASLLWLRVAPTLGLITLLMGLAIRVGVVPFHSWFPRFVGRAPMGLVVAFAGPQLGFYAQLELLGDHGLGSFTHIVAAFGATTAVLAAMLGVVQDNARRAVAYLILSQTGLIAFGLESQSTEGLVGALLNWQVLAVATSGFAMALAALEARRGHAQLTSPHGNFAQTPRLATAFLMLGFASVGFPLTMGFVAEDLLVQGTVDQFPMLGLSLVVATAFNGVSVLRAFFYLFTGSRKSQSEPDLSRRETYVFGVAIAGLLINGLLPGPLVSFEDPHRDASRTHASETPENGTALELGLLDSPAEPMVATSNKTKP